MSFLISIIIPTYNRINLLTKTIESVLRQTYLNFEIIVIDDGSTDDTKDRLAQFTISNKVRYQYQTNQGRSVARNKGIGLAKGEWLMFLDSDDLLTPNALQILLDKSLQHSSAGLIVGNTGSIDEEGKQLEHKFKYNIKEGMLNNCYSSLIRREFCFLLGSYMVKKSIVDVSGKFDNLMEPSEDSDFVWRVSLNTDVYYTSEIIMFYRAHQGNTVQTQIRNAELNVAKKHMQQFVPLLRNSRLYASHLAFFEGASHHEMQEYSQAIYNYLLSIWYAPTTKLIDWNIYRQIIGCLSPNWLKTYKNAVTNIQFRK